MVSPLEKGGNTISYTSARASVSGDAVTYSSAGAFGESKGLVLQDRYLSRRGPSGWSLSNISPPNQIYETNTIYTFEELLFSPELSRGLFLSMGAPLVSGEAPDARLYLWNEGQAAYQTVSTVTPLPSEETPAGAVNTHPQAVGVSSDLTHVVFQQPVSLVEGASSGHRVHVYEWADGRLSQVDVPPEGVAFHAEDQAGAPGVEYDKTILNVWHAVSADGSRVFFTAGEEDVSENAGEASDLGQLYVRENPMAPQSPTDHGVCTAPGDACTVEVSASQRAVPDPHGPQAAFFRGASADGSLVLFRTVRSCSSSAERS